MLTLFGAVTNLFGLYAEGEDLVKHTVLRRIIKNRPNVHLQSRKNGHV